MEKDIHTIENAYVNFVGLACREMAIIKKLIKQ